jgi:hypothetical protein
MKRKAGVAAAGLALLLFLMGAAETLASTTTYYGCFKCKYITLTGLASICSGVAPLQGGDGWKCYEDNTLPWPDGPICWVDGGPCTNGGDGGGGAGGSAGGGTDPCATSGFCPAQCFSCGDGGGRPAV